MTRVFHCSTLFGALTLAAAVDDGRFGPHDERRLLLVSNTTPTPEAYPSAAEQRGFDAVRDRFDDVVSWNDLIAPLHPAAWSPRLIETPMTARLVGHRLGLDGPPAELVLESVSAAPGRSVAALIRDCPITVYADGLSGYGPTPDPVPPETEGRIGRLLHLDLVPGLRPLHLSEYDVAAEALPVAAFRAVADALLPIEQPAVEHDAAGDRRALIVGQSLSTTGVLTTREELELYLRMLDALVAGGYDHVVLAPHPAAGRTHIRELSAGADERGVGLTITSGADPAEALFAALRPDLVVSCFSTALTTASASYDLPVATMGSELVLERLAPYENADRIAATIVDATVSRLQPDGSVVEAPPVDLQLLVRAVGYCMQSEAYPQLRASAVDHLALHGRARYFKKRRLEVLELIAKPAPPPPAAPPPPPPAPPTSLTGSLRAAAAERIKRRTRG